MKKFLFNIFLPPFLGWIILLWCKTLRIKNLDPEMEKKLRAVEGPHILTFWHSRIFLILYYFRDRSDVSIMVSPSSDGDLIANLCLWMGYKVVRGSSFKKAVSSSRSLVKTLNEGKKAAVIADGSRGPRRIAQMGTLHLARVTGATYSGCSWDAQWKYEFNSWDRFILPFPFSRCRIHFGPILILEKDLIQNHYLELKRSELEGVLNRITRECECS